MFKGLWPVLEGSAAIMHESMRDLYFTGTVPDIISNKIFEIYIFQNSVISPLGHVMLLVIVSCRQASVIYPFFVMDLFSVGSLPIEAINIKMVKVSCLNLCLLIVIWYRTSWDVTQQGPIYK